VKTKLILAAALAFGTLSLCADEVTDTIEGALSAYKNGEYSMAAEDLGYALELIKQKKGENLKDYLPEPLTGWKAEAAEAQTAGAGMMGGGTIVNRIYEKGEGRVKIEIVTDSPLMQSFAMVLANPAFATSDGGKLMRIGRQKAIVSYDAQGHSGDIKMVVGNRFLVTVEGTAVSESDLVDYAKAIDLEKLTSMQ